MKKTLIRIVAVVLLAVMVLSALPAFASGFVGTISQPTSLYKKADTGSGVIATVSGTVDIHYQNNAGTMYQITVVSGGKSYTGWVPASAVSNIGRGSATTGNVGSSSSSAVSSTYFGSISSPTNVYSDANKLVATVSGTVNVNYRNFTSDQVHITATGSGVSISGWVPAAAFSRIYNRRTGSIKVSDLPTNGSGSSAATTATYTAYKEMLSAVSNDRTIYVRPTATKSTSGATKIRDAKGLTFTLMGESGDFYYASHGTAIGFVRKQDFSVTSGTVNTTPTTPNTNAGSTTPNVGTTYPKAQPAVSTDSTIYMRVNPDKSTSSSNVVVKVTNAKGVQFSLLGETGDWYYAEYTKNGTPYRGYVRKQDFSLVTANTNTNTNAPIQGAVANSSSSSGSASAGTGSSSEKWGSFSVPGGSTYTIYGNYYKNVGGTNYYYYAEESIGNYNYLHTTTAKGSQIQVVMGHNMRDSKTMFHKLHHVQNAILGKSSCEGCGGSCGSSYNTTTFSASLDGYNTWDILCFYEIPQKSSTYSSLLAYNAQPWTSNTSSYISKQIQLAQTSGLKGWVNPNVSATNNGKYMMLITCGDKFERSSNATSKLYMVLKAR